MHNTITFRIRTEKHPSKRCSYPYIGVLVCVFRLYNGLSLTNFLLHSFVQHRDFAKRKKKIASELCDKEKLGDSYLVIGESYQKLRNFNKALKWYTKSWETYNSIGNLEVSSVCVI